MDAGRWKSFLMKNCFRVIFLIISFHGQSQICPLKDGDAILRHFDIFTKSDPNIAKIESINSDVFSVSDGEVVSLINSSNIYSVIIKKKAKLDQYYIYSNLSSTIIQKGDLVSANQILGNAIEEKGRYSIRFQYRILSEKQNEVINCGEVNIYH